jgi:hypothetical protein
VGQGKIDAVINDVLRRKRAELDEQKESQQQSGSSGKKTQPGE